MKGATTDPCENTIRAPIKTIVIINGASQYFFLTLRKSQMSCNNSKKSFIAQKILVRSKFSSFLISL